VNDVIRDPRELVEEHQRIVQAVQRRAYEIWEERGHENSNDWAHWFQARHELGIPDNYYVSYLVTKACFFRWEEVPHHSRRSHALANDREVRGERLALLERYDDNRRDLGGEVAKQVAASVPGNSSTFE